MFPGLIKYRYYVKVIKWASVLGTLAKKGRSAMLPKFEKDWDLVNRIALFLFFYSVLVLV